MEGLFTNFAVVLFVIYFILCLVIYHKLFDVIYIDFFNAIIKEGVIGAIFASILMCITLYNWWIVTIIIIIIGLILIAKYPEYKGAIFVLFAILAIVMSVFGSKLQKKIDDNKAKEQATQESTYNHDN